MHELGRQKGERQSSCQLGKAENEGVFDDFGFPAGQTTKENRCEDASWPENTKNVRTVHLQASFDSSANTYTKKQPRPPFFLALNLSSSRPSHVGLLCTNEEQKRVESTHKGVN